MFNLFLAAWLAPLSCSEAALGSPFEPSADPGLVFKSMKAEMTRSMDTLKLDRFAAPYFLLYRLTHNQELSLGASYGSVYRTEFSNQQTLYVEARYGDYSLDNVESDFNGQTDWGPLDGGASAMRQTLWGLTDTAYKRAVAGYLRKKAKKATELEKDRLDSFSREKTVIRLRDIQPPAPVPQGIGRLEQTMKQVSLAFGGYPEIEDSNVNATVRWSERFLLTSEGTELEIPHESVPDSLSLYASARDRDGTLLESYRRWVSTDVSSLPAAPQLLQGVSEMAQEIKRLRSAEPQQPSAAPAILDPEFTGVFFHEAIGHRLEGQRQRNEEESQTFKDLVGHKVIPEFLSVIDDPTLKEYNGVPAHGHYLYDDEGVPAQRAVLIENGILRNFLMSRYPVKGFSQSNGHGRSDSAKHPVGRMANLMVVAKNPVPLSKLKQLLLKECRLRGKPYGFILRGSMGGDDPTERASPQTLRVKAKLVFRVDAKTGKETLVRGVELVGTPLVVINKIIAAGDDSRLSNAYNCGAESGWIPVDQIAPSVLVSEVELQRIEENRERPPLIPSPLPLNDSK